MSDLVIDVASLEKNTRGYSDYLGVCIHDSISTDGIVYEAKTNVNIKYIKPQTLHLGLFSIRDWKHPEWCAAYVAQMFRNNIEVNYDLYVGQSWQVVMPHYWKFDGELLPERNCQLFLKRGDVGYDWYSYRHDQEPPCLKNRPKRIPMKFKKPAQGNLLAFMSNNH